MWRVIWNTITWFFCEYRLCMEINNESSVSFFDIFLNNFLSLVSYYATGWRHMQNLIIVSGRGHPYWRKVTNHRNDFSKDKFFMTKRVGWVVKRPLQVHGWGLNKSASRTRPSNITPGNKAYNTGNVIKENGLVFGSYKEHRNRLQ